jgi:hypothetical protein
MLIEFVFIDTSLQLAKQILFWNLVGGGGGGMSAFEPEKPGIFFSPVAPEGLYLFRAPSRPPDAPLASPVSAAEAFGAFSRGGPGPQEELRRQLQCKLINWPSTCCCCMEALTTLDTILIG